MEILNTTITRKAKLSTTNAVYELDYVISNEALIRVTSTIYENTGTDSLSYLGNINFENGTINCSLPADIKPALYFEDFDVILAKIKVDVSSLSLKKEKTAK